MKCIHATKLHDKPCGKYMQYFEQFDSRVMCMENAPDNTVLLGTLSWMLYAYDSKTRQEFKRTFITLPQNENVKYEYQVFNVNCDIGQFAQQSKYFLNISLQLARKSWNLKCAKMQTHVQQSNDMSIIRLHVQQ